MNPLSFIVEALGSSLAHEADREAAFANIQSFKRSEALEAANAVSALQRGGLEAGLHRQRGTQVTGQQQLVHAMAGVEAGSGTAATLRDSSTAFAELDAQTARNNALRAALGHREVERRYREERQRLDARWNPEGGITGSRADDELFAKTATSLIGSAIGFGMGGI